MTRLFFGPDGAAYVQSRILVARAGATVCVIPAPEWVGTVFLVLLCAAGFVLAGMMLLLACAKKHRGWQVPPRPNWPPPGAGDDR